MAHMGDALAPTEWLVFHSVEVKSGKEKLLTMRPSSVRSGQRHVWLPSSIGEDDDPSEYSGQGPPRFIEGNCTEEEKLDYRLLVDNSAEGMLICANDGETLRILQANPEACRITGRRHEDLAGAGCEDIFDPSDPRLKLGFEEQRRIGKFEGEIRLLQPHRKTFTARVSIITLEEQRIGVIFRSLTERLRADEKIKNLNEELNGQVAQLTATMSEVDDYEEILRETTDRLRALFEQVAVGMALVELDGSWLWINRKLCDILDYYPGDLYGMALQEIIHPDDRDANDEYIHRLLAKDRATYQAEKRCLRKDESIVWIKLTISPVLDSSGNPKCLVAVIEDITERKRADEALRQSEELYRTVVEQAAENIFLVDTETKRIVESNAALHSSLGYSEEELERMTLYDIVAHDRESINQNIAFILQEGRYYCGERLYKRKDGSLMELEVNVSTAPYGVKTVMCVVAHDVTERNRAEKRLRHSLGILLALREAGQTLASTLESEEIISRLLEIMQRVSNLSSVMISLRDKNGNLRIWRSVGLQELGQRARFTHEAQAARRATVESKERRLFRLQRLNSGTGHLTGLCLPLCMQDSVVGVLEAYGPESLVETDTVELIASITSQAARALENARLHEELGERECRLQDLVEKLLGTQEEERHRVSYEVHDGLAQIAAAAHQHLQAFAQRYSLEEESSRRDLERILRLVRQTVTEARRIIANLRPTILDDLGLAPTILLEAERLREEGYDVLLEEALGEERLPAPVETTLFRIAQEALTNMRKHSQTKRVCIKLGYRGDKVELEIQDWGQGFDPTAAATGNGPGERVGLAGMRERVGMLGGKLEIRSRLGTGTYISASVPRDAARAPSSERRPRQ